MEGCQLLFKRENGNVFFETSDLSNCVYLLLLAKKHLKSKQQDIYCCKRVLCIRHLVYVCRRVLLDNLQIEEENALVFKEVFLNN